MTGHKSYQRFKGSLLKVVTCWGGGGGGGGGGGEEITCDGLILHPGVKALLPVASC